MNKLEAVAWMGASAFLGLVIASRVWEPPPKPPSLSTPLPTPLDLGTPSPTDGLSNEECVSQSNALNLYLRTGFKESTGFDWMRAKHIENKDIEVLTSCPTLQGEVVAQEGINLREIPYVNPAYKRGALAFDTQVDFHHIIWIGKETWGARGAGNDFEFFIIKSGGREFVKVKNPPEPFPNNGNFGQDQGGFPYGRYTWAKQLEEKQPPNVRMVRTGGRVFIA